MKKPKVLRKSIPSGVVISSKGRGLEVEHVSGEGYHALLYIRSEYSDRPYRIKGLGTMREPEGTGDIITTSSGDRVQMGRSSFHIEFI